MNDSQTALPVVNLLKVLNRKRTVFLTATLLALAFVALVYFTRTPRYDSTAIFQFQKEGAGALNLDSLMGGGGGAGGGVLGENVDMQTQSAILQADTIELNVIQSLHLEDTKDFNHKSSWIGSLLDHLMPGPPVVPATSDTLEGSPLRRMRALKVFKQNLHVNVVAGTHLIQVTYTSTDPKLAADVANALVHELVEYTFETKFNATSEVSVWLEHQLGDLRKQNEDLQSKVIALQKTTGLYGLAGGSGASIYSPALEQLEQATTALSQAQENAIIKGSVYRTVSSGDADLISQLSGSGTLVGASQGVPNTLTLIQSLRAQEATLEAQVAQDASVFGPAYPKLIQERASLAKVKESLRSEIARIQERAKNDYEIAQRDLAGAQAEYAKDKAEASKLNDRAIEYSIVSREADESQKLYQSLLERLREAGILEGLHSSTITIVDQARVPAKPSHPSTATYFFGGILFALFCGLGSALVGDSIDNALQSVDEVTDAGLPLLGVLPVLTLEDLRQGTGESRISIVRRPGSPYSEAIRRLRSSILISHGSTPPKVMLVTSATPEEGKSTTSIELAASFAQLGKRVLVIEADLRRPVLGGRLGLNSKKGLTYILSGQSSSLDFPSLPEIPSLYVLPAGPTPPSPADLLSSEKMQWLIAQCREQYDLVVIDSAPVLAVTDAEVLTHLAETTVLVVRAGFTTRVSMARASSLLKHHIDTVHHATFGVVVNRLALSASGYYGYYGSRDLDYSQEGS